MKKQLLTITALVVGCLFFSFQVMAADVCVDDLTEGAAAAEDCSDTCDGSDDCSLRDALAAAGTNDTIFFKAGLIGTMDITSSLSLSVGSVTIDGEINDHDHDIIINGTGTSGIHCFNITSGSNVIKGLVVQNCYYGMYVNGSSAVGNKIQNNYIGTNATGDDAVANAVGVAFMSGASNNIAGFDGTGTAADERNIISGNASYGVQLYGTGTTGNVVAGNYIGLDVTGTTAVANGGTGVRLAGAPQSNIIGTNSDGAGDDAEGNVISGNTIYGVFLGTSGTNNNVVAGNYIGLDAAGTGPVANAHGVYINDAAASNIVGTDGDGTADEAERNVISGNTNYGVYIKSAGTDNNVVAGNYIGLDAAGTGSVANNYGILIYTAAKSNIVGTDGDGTADEAERNVISGNTKYGIYIGSAGTDNNVVAGNYIGLDAAGTDAVANAYGVVIQTGAQSNIVGTNSDGASDDAERNVISGNTNYGASIQGAGTDNNVVAGNYIGLDAAGTGPVGNTHGVYISNAAESNIVGTDGDGTADEAERNVISGNISSGVYILNEGTDNNVVAGNYVGLDAAGTTAVANSYGVVVASAAKSNIVGTDGDGTADDAERNVISGNTNYGVYIANAGTDNNVVAGNYVGTGTDGATDLGSGAHGVYIAAGAASNTIGGDIAAEENLIRYNGNAAGEYGIYIDTDAGAGNQLLHNIVYDNQEDIQIKVDANATTAPSSLAGSAGASGGKISISLNSAAGNSVQVFKDTDGDGICEAMEYLTDATDIGDGTFSYLSTDFTLGTKVAFAATDATNNTSELACYTIVNLAPVLTAIGAKAVNEAANLQFSVAGYDPNVEDTVGFSALDLPGGSSFVSPLFDWTPSYIQAGIYSPQFTASDGVLEDSETVTITVNNTGRAPSLSAPADYTGREGETVIQVVPEATHEDTDETVTYTASNLPSGASFSSADRTFSWTPSNNQAGTYIVTFTATDNGGSKQGGSDLSDSAEWRLVIEVGNTVPVAMVGSNVTVLEGTSVTLDGSSSYDEDGDELTYRWNKLAGPEVSLAGSDAPQVTFVAPSLATGVDSALLLMRLTVSDDDGNSDNATLTVRVNKSEYNKDEFETVEGNVKEYMDIGASGERRGLVVTEEGNGSGQTVSTIVLPDGGTEELSISLTSGGIKLAKGDLNADGLEDLIIGAPEVSGNRGRVYVLEGGSGLSGDIDLETQRADIEVDGSAAGDLLGTLVASGDINGDDIADLIMYAPGYQDSGALFAVLGGAGILDSTSVPFVDVTIDLGGNGVGDILMTDVDNDGYDDIAYVVNSAASSSEGVAEGIDASESGMSGSSVKIVLGFAGIAGDVGPSDILVETDGAAEISALASCDVDGDSKTDLIVGCSNMDRVYVIKAVADFGASVSISDASLIFRGNGGGLDEAGYAVACGDVDGSGLADIAVGAPGALGSDGNRDYGAVYLVYGSEDLTGEIEVNVGTSAMTKISGTQADERFGTEVRMIDASGEGTVDLLMVNAWGQTTIMSFAAMTTAYDALLIEEGHNSPADVVAMLGEKGVVMLQIKLTNTSVNALTVNSLTVSASGTGADDADIEAVRLIEDVSGNGIIDSGDEQVGTDQLYNCDDGEATFSGLGYRLDANGVKYLLVVYDFSSMLPF